MTMNLSIIIPAYNEELRVKKTLDAVYSYIKQKKGLRAEVIFVDDGSSDKTCDIAKKYRSQGLRLLKNSHNMGKGYSVRKGILAAKFDIVLFMDADLSTPIGEIDHFLGYINDYDILIASRNLALSSKDIKQPWYRTLAGQTFPFFVRLLVLPGFKDTQCGFKMLHRPLAQKIVKHQQLFGWAFDVELLFVARKLRSSIKELPVRWIDMPGSKLHFFRDSFCMFRDILLIRLYNLFGKYPKR